MMSSLHVIERIGYHIPDWSALKIQALQQHSLDMPREACYIQLYGCGTSCMIWE
jgi:hypothetical protein